MLTCLTTLAHTEPAAWDALVPRDQPMLRHAFLSAIEAAQPPGWQSAHAVITDTAGQLQAAMPGWFKSHSRGEYVFDQTWAEASHRAGLAYYPKWLSAVPFTPITGPRLLGSPEAAFELVTALPTHPAWTSAHSWHVNFTDDASNALMEHAVAAGAPWLRRHDVQFHWSRDQETDFEGFLARLTADRRKKIRQERRKLTSAALTFRWVAGSDLTEAEQHAMYACYAHTYAVRGQVPYLPPAFFQAVSDALGASVQVLLIQRTGHIVAMAWYLQGTETFYGRYWGALEDIPLLHFEACYYQGIERALALGLSRFNAGAQGEHKLIRGFQPVMTTSWHRLKHPGLHQAVADFLDRERRAVAGYAAEAQEACPYRQASS